MFCEGTGIGIPGHASLGPAEVRTFQAGPEDDLGVRVYLTGNIDVLDHRAELQRTDVFRVVDGIRVVGLMGRDGVLVVVDTGDDLGDFLSSDDGILYSGGCAAGAAEEVDIQEFDVIFHLLDDFPWWNNSVFAHIHSE